MRDYLLPIAIVVAAAVTVGAPAIAQQSLNGNLFLDFSQQIRVTYITGFVHGLVLANEIPTLWAAECMAGKTGRQALAMVEKYLAEHPEQWNRPTPDLVIMALGEQCPVR